MCLIIRERVSRMIKNEFQNFCAIYKDKIISYLNKNTSYDGKLDSYFRTAYRNGKTYNQLICRIKFTINKGKFFDETISFRFIIDEEMDIVIIYENYSINPKSYSKYKAYDLCNYILSTINSQENVMHKQKINVK